MGARAKFILIALIFLFGIDLHAQGIPYQLNPPAPNARVQFCPVPDGGYPCPILTTVYSDSPATQIINQPISTGSSGNLSVYFAAGTSSVTVQLLGQGYGPQNRFVVSLSGGGANFGPLSFFCANCNANVQYAYVVTCTNNSTAISTGPNDPPFTVADATSGKLIVGGTANNAAANCPPLGTITGFTDAHHVTVSVPATTSTTTALGNFPALAWGTQDDGPNLRNAFLSSLGKGCLYLPAGNLFAGAAGSDGKNLFIDNRSTTATGYPACVIGAYTNITLLPTFNYANCLDACFFTWSAPGQAIGINPNYAFIKDWVITEPNYQLTGSGASFFGVDWQRTTLENIWLQNIPSLNVGFGGSGPISAFSPIAFNAGQTACAGTGLITIEQGYCAGFATSFAPGANATVTTKGITFGTPLGGAGPTATFSSGLWISLNDFVFAGGGAADALRVNGGQVVLKGDTLNGGNANTLGAVDCNASGANVVIEGGILNGGGGGGLALRSVAGCNIKVRAPVTVTNYAASLAGNNVSDPSETQTGACVTNAATVTFKLTYQVAPLVIVSDTTSASTGAQATATNTTTATIHCNGASDTFVAIVIPNPI